MTAIQAAPSGYLDRPSGGGLAEVIDIIRDKGLVIDAYVRVSLIGIEILTIDARIVIASVDTYLRFAEAVNRLDLARADTSKDLPEMVDDVTEGSSRSKTKGAIGGAKEKLGIGDSGDDDDDNGGKRGSRRQKEGASGS
jgi:gas vesicle structural protein